ncbi:MAG: DUF3052 family protein [Streptosporangiales bacterium]|nr:DUF3052 family protein [Streptosporangiales bacterium]
MSATAEHADGQKGAVADRLGLSEGLVVQELGYDDDCDDALRKAVEQRIGGELVDEDYDDVVDVVLLWWRESDGDPADGLLEAPASLVDGGVIWLLTPKAGRDEYIEPSDISESAVTAGLQATSSVSAAADWVGTRLVPPRAKGRK